LRTAEAPPNFERGGYSVEFDTLARIGNAKLWGFWDVEVAERFRAELLAIGHRQGGGSWSILVDSRSFLPQSPEVTRHRRETMGMILSQGCRRIAVVVVENGTYAMQFARIAKEAGVTNAVFFDAVQALAWLREA
jgi:hypothetical protein